jgi:hypothetical protein
VGRCVVVECGCMWVWGCGGSWGLRFGVVWDEVGWEPGEGWENEEGVWKGGVGVGFVGFLWWWV